MKTSLIKLLTIFFFSFLCFCCNNPEKIKLAPPAVNVQFYSMTLSKVEIKKYLASDNDRNFRRLIFQFYQEQAGNTIKYKIRGWLLKEDLSSYPAAGNLLTTGSPITQNIPASPVYFANCEVKNTDFIRDILQQVGGLNGNWQFITLTPQQNADGYLQVLLEVDIPGFLKAKTVANPCPPKTPQG